MIRPNILLEQYKYKISDIVLTYNDSIEAININNNLIKNILINNDFENNVISSMMVNIVVPKSYYTKIITHMDTLIATFDIYKCNIGNSISNNDNEYDKTEQYVLYAHINLKALNSDNINTNVANRMPPENELSSKETSDSTDYTQDLIPLTLYLYDSDRLSKYKINSSFIINGGINDVIYHMFKKRNFDKILMDPIPGNPNNTYIIPYGHIGDNLQALNEYYGIYDYPYLFYMGLKRNYLINKGNVGRCLETGEMGLVNIYLEQNDEAGSSTETGCYCDDINKMYILNAVTFDIMDNDSAIDHAIGGKISTVIRGTGEIKHDTIGEYDIERSYVVNNSKQHSQLIYSIKESKRGVELVFSNIDLDIFTPNKLYTIIPDDNYYTKDYNIQGKYRLVSSNIVISRQGEDELKASIEVSLNKIKD